MERDNLDNNLVCRRSMKEHLNIINKNKVKDSWEYCTSYENHYGGDLLSGYLWSPRSYTCSFCKREFKSAQALGGHMNVHRRDRARLRQYSPPNPNPNHPIPNLNLDPNTDLHNSSSSFSVQSSYPSTHLSQNSTVTLPIGTKKWAFENSSCHYKVRQDLQKVNYSKSLFGVERYEVAGDENERGVLKNPHVITLDLEIGLITAEKEALDLELRLGR